MKVKFKIHPLFLIVILLSAYFGNLHLIVSYLLALFIHEMGHAIVAVRCGNKLKSICLMPYGAVINLEKDNMSPKNEFLIALGGPTLNLITVLIMLAIWWLFPAVSTWSTYFVFASVVTGVYNLLPFLPLDGSRAILALCNLNGKRAAAYKFLKIFTFICSLLLFGLFIYSAFYEINYTIGMMAVFMIVDAGGNDEYIYSNCLNEKYLLNKKLKINMITVSDEASLDFLRKQIKPSSYLVVIILDKNHKPIKTLYENEIVNLLVNK